MGVMEPPGPVKQEPSAAALRLSCAECRRRKLKCDRKIPCSCCIKRGCQSLCPDGVLPPKNAVKGSAYGTLESRVFALEAILREHDIAIPPDIKSAKLLGKGKEKERPVGPGGGGGGASSSDDDERTTPTGGRRKEDSDEEDDWIPSFGTLELGKAGRARFVGATAGSEWLSNESMHSSTPANERSSRATTSNLSFLPAAVKPYSREGSSTYAALRAQLPAREEALYLIELYYLQYAWLHTVVTHTSLLSHFEAFYSSERNQPPPLSADEWTSETHPHKLALLFVALAMGSYYDPRRSTLDGGQASKYNSLCVEALELAANDPTVASLQSLHIMANYLLSIDRIKGGDVVWSLWGTLTRQAVAMGMHRDGQRWNLPPLICDERRRVWWEIITEDVFQSNCFGRPGGMTPAYFDTNFPEEVDSFAPGPTDDPQVGYSITKFKMGKLANEVAEKVLSTTPPSYADVTRLSKKIAAFEKTIPYFLACRPALLATTSAYPTHEEAIRASPETKELDMRLTYQQHTLSLNVSEAQFFLLRPFFARALNENPADPSKSKYGEAYLCVAERCSIMITILMSVQTLYPTVTPRQWFFWYHASSAAVCMASLVISAPQSPLALFGWMNLQSVCNLFSSLATQSKSTMTSLTLLLKLREKASDAMSGRKASFIKAPSPIARASHDSGLGNDGSDDEGESNNLIGLHTRLIERGNQGMARSRVFKGNVRSPSPRQQVSQGSSNSKDASRQLPSDADSPGFSMKMETEDLSLDNWTNTDPLLQLQQLQQQHEQQQLQQFPHYQPLSDEYLNSFNQLRQSSFPAATDAVEGTDLHTAGILGSLWAPQSEQLNDWSTANQQLDWEGISATLGIDFSVPDSNNQQQQQQQQRSNADWSTNAGQPSHQQQ